METSLIQAAIFDMDGLLIDSEPLWMEAELKVLRGVGVPLLPANCVETRGWRVDEVVAYWFSRHPWEGPAPHMVAGQLVDAVIELVQKRGAPLPGAIEAIEALSERFGVVGLASSSPTILIEAVLEVLGVRSHFQVVHSAEGEAFGKPHPAVFLSAARKLGMDPTRCLVLEDSFAGVLAAKAARMKCIAVPEAGERGDPRFVIADRILGSLEELDRIDWTALTR